MSCLCVCAFVKSHSVPVARRWAASWPHPVLIFSVSAGTESAALRATARQHSDTAAAGRPTAERRPCKPPTPPTSAEFSSLSHTDSIAGRPDMQIGARVAGRF